MKTKTWGSGIGIAVALNPAGNRKKIFRALSVIRRVDQAQRIHQYSRPKWWIRCA